MPLSNLQFNTPTPAQGWAPTPSGRLQVAPGWQPQPGAADTGVGADAGFSPYDDVFLQYIPPSLRGDQEFLRILAAGSLAESGWDRTRVGDSGHSVGLFQLHDRGAGAGLSVAQRQDPQVQAQIMVPRYAAAYQQMQNGQRGGPSFAAQVAAAAERPAGWNDPGSTAWGNYRSAYNRVTGGQAPDTGSYASADTTSNRADAPPMPPIHQWTLPEMQGLLDQFRGQQQSSGPPQVTFNDTPLPTYTINPDGSWSPIDTAPPPEAPAESVTDDIKTPDWGAEPDPGEGQDVGVGWGWDDATSWLGDRASDLGSVAHAVGGAFFPQSASYGEQATPEQYQQIDDQGQWNPGRWVQDTVTNATQGQAGIYDAPLVGGIARAGGLAANLALGAANVPFEGAMYGAGVLGGLGQLAIDQEHAGQQEQFDYGNLGGQRAAPVARTLGDVFDPAQAEARAHAAAGPAWEGALGLTAGDLLGPVGDVAGAAGRAVDRVEEATLAARRIEAGRTFRIADVPTKIGLAEDTGRILASDTIRNASFAALPTAGAAIGFTEGDPGNPDDMGARLERGALGAFAGLALAAGGQAAAPALRQGAENFRIMNYFDAARSDDRIATLLNKVDRTSFEDDQLQRLQDEREKATALIQKYHPDYNRPDTPSWVNDEIERQVKAQVDAVGAPISQAAAIPSSSEYPYLGRVMNRIAFVATNNRVAADGYQHVIDVVGRLMESKTFSTRFNISNPLAMLSNANGAAAEVTSQILGPTMRNLGIDGDRAAQGLANELRTNLYAYDRALTDTVQAAQAEAAGLPTRMQETQDAVDKVQEQLQRIQNTERRYAAREEMTTADSPMRSRTRQEGLEDKLQSLRAQQDDLLARQQELRAQWGEDVGTITPREYLRRDMLQQVGPDEVRRKYGLDYSEQHPADPTVRTQQMGEPTGTPADFVPTGEGRQSLPEVNSLLWYTTKRIADLYGVDAPAKWATELFAETDRGLKAALFQLARSDTRALSPDQLQKLIDQNGIYATLKSIGDYNGDFLAKGYASQTPTGLSVKFMEDRNSIIDASQDTIARHYDAVTRTAMQNRAFTALVDAADNVPGFSEVFRPLRDPTGEYYTLDQLVGGTALPAETTGLHKGWDIISGLQHDQMQYWAAPQELADAYRTMAPGAANAYLNLASKFSSIFRAGVTTMSVPFILGNYPRDMENALQQSKMPMAVMRNYLGANFELATRGLDQWLQDNPANPMIQSLPGRIAQSLYNGLSDAALGPLGRQLRNVNKGGYGNLTLTEQIRAMPSLGGPQIDNPILKGIGKVLKTPFDVLDALAYNSEMTSRLSVFRAGLESGMSEKEAGYMMRSAIVDYSRGGEFSKTFGMLAPLVNARLQHQLAAVNAFQDDPQGYLHRMTVGAALPTMALYAYNRERFGDLYDGVPLTDRDRNWIVGYGTVTVPGKGEQMLYYKIPKNDPAMLVANPIEQLMNTVFHTKKDKVDLTDPQKADRSAGQMWLQQFANMMPTSINANDINGGGLAPWWNAFVGMNPLTGTISQMQANRDDFTDRQLIPDDQLVLPREFQRGENGAIAPWLARAAAQGAKQLGLPAGMQPAAPQLAFLASHLGGTAATIALGTTDKIWQAFKDAGFELPSYEPMSVVDFHTQKSTSDQDAQAYQAYLDAMQHVNMRPWQEELVKRFYGQGGYGTTIEARVEQLSAPERKTWQDTMGYDHESTLIRQEYSAQKSRIYNDTSLTAAGIRTKIDDLNKQQIGAIDELWNPNGGKYPDALHDPQSRDQFMANLPGLPIDQTLPQAWPTGVDVNLLAQKYQNPPTVTPDMGPIEVQAARQKVLDDVADQNQLSRQTVRDQVAAVLLNGKLPALPVPDTFLNDAVDRYLTPDGIKNPDDAGELAKARQDYVQQLAKDWGADPHDVLERIQTRMVSIQDADPTALSRARAASLAMRLHDQSQFPTFVNDNGSAVGAPTEWPAFQAELAAAKAFYKNRPFAMPQLYQELEHDQANGKIMQLAAAYQDPNYQDYEGWYGAGKNVSPQTWQGYLGGQNPRYQDQPSQAEATKRDALLKLYATLPAGPQRMALRPQFEMYHRMLTKGWSQLMALDDFAARNPDVPLDTFQ